MEGGEGSGGPPCEKGVVLRPYWLAGSGPEPLLVGWEWPGGPPGGGVGVEMIWRMSWLDKIGQEVPSESQEWLGGTLGGPGMVRRPFQWVGRPSRWVGRPSRWIGRPT